MIDDIRGGLLDHDAHVVDHPDDVFDLVSLDDAGGEMVVDLGVGQITLFFALGDQLLQLRLLLFLIHGVP